MIYSFFRLVDSIKLLIIIRTHYVFFIIIDQQLTKNIQKLEINIE